MAFDVEFARWLEEHTRRAFFRRFGVLEIVERNDAGTAASRIYCISVFEIAFTEQNPGADSLIRNAMMCSNIKLEHYQYN